MGEERRAEEETEHAKTNCAYFKYFLDWAMCLDMERNFSSYAFYSTLPALLLAAWFNACKVPEIELQFYYCNSTTLPVS